MAEPQKKAAAPADAPAESAARAADTETIQVRWNAPRDGIKRERTVGRYTWKSDGFGTVTGPKNGVDPAWWVEHQPLLADEGFTDQVEG